MILDQRGLKLNKIVTIKALQKRSLVKMVKKISFRLSVYIALNE